MQAAHLLPRLQTVRRQDWHAVRVGRWLQRVGRSEWVRRALSTDGEERHCALQSRGLLRLVGLHGYVSEGCRQVNAAVLIERLCIGPEYATKLGPQLITFKNMIDGLQIDPNNHL